MSVVLLIVGLVILIAVVYAASGRGGELPPERADYAPLELGPVSATDVALLRPPSAMWGYDVQATDDALDRIAESIRERDVRIVALEQLVTDLSREDPAQAPLGTPFPGARHRRGPELPAATEPPARIEPPARTEADDTPPDSLAAAPIPGQAPTPPPAWPQTPMRAVSGEAVRPTTPQPRLQGQPEPAPSPGESGEEPGQQQRKPPPERSHG